MKKLILITLILLLHSFPSFSKPKELGIICKWSDTELVKKDRLDKRFKGYYFEDGSVHSYYFSEENDKLNIKQHTNLYNYDVDYISWEQNEIIQNLKESTNSKEIRYMYVLDRKTLELGKIQNFDSGISDIQILRCEIDVKSKNKKDFETLFLFDGFMKYQSELDKILEKNKI